MAKEVITFGCRLNHFESAIIKQHVQESALEQVAVFNTCAVTKEAERQARQQIRRYRRANPDATIIVTGCAAQIDPQAYAKLPEVDKVLGNGEKLESRFYTPLAENAVHVGELEALRETASHLVESFEGRARAFLQVQNGCDHRCTFCIIPYGRGPSRSVPVGEVVRQGLKLVQSGFNEMVFTGVDMTSYGADLPGKPALGELTERFLKLVPVPRLRLSSIDVAEVDETLFRLFAEDPRVMPHVHLSLQSGDDMVLKRMKRRHTRDQVLRFTDRLRKARPDVAFGADIIAGFPTESDEMFENTHKLIAEAGLTWLHIFPYSEREGTPAAKIPVNKQVPVPIRKARAEALREIGKAQQQLLLTSRLNRNETVVVEQGNIGRTEQFAQVKLAANAPEGTLQHVKITGIEGDYLLAG